MGKATEKLAEIEEILSELEPAEAAQIVTWLSASYKIGNNFGRQVSLADKVEDFAGFFAEAAPSTDADRVLVAGYWIQQKEGKGDITGYEVNKKLRDLGHGVSNVTKAFGSLISEKPQLAIQVAKGGKAKQAKKRYRITIEGFNRIREMTQKGGENNG